jgi:hypothetical protein
MKISNDIWCVIGTFLFLENFDLFLVSKNFTKSFSLMLKTAFVSISLWSNIRVLEQYAWCIDELYLNTNASFPNMIFTRLKSLTILMQNDHTLTLLQFPMLKHLSITNCMNIKFNTLQLISLCVKSDMKSSDIHGIHTLKYLHFSSCLSTHGMILLLQTLPNLIFLQINDAENRDVLRKLFPRVYIDIDWENFAIEWTNRIQDL